MQSEHLYLTPDYTVVAGLVRQVLALQPAYAHRGARFAAAVEHEQSRLLQRVEDSLAAMLVASGMPAEQASLSAFAFVSQCTTFYASQTAKSC